MPVGHRVQLWAATPQAAPHPTLQLAPAQQVPHADAEQEVLDTRDPAGQAGAPGADAAHAATEAAPLEYANRPAAQAVHPEVPVVTPE